MIKNKSTLIEKIKEFMEQEAKSCSMDYGCITPLYVYRHWGGKVSLEEIEEAWSIINSKK